MVTPPQLPPSKHPARKAHAPAAPNLPGPQKAWDFIRRCFDIRDKDLNAIGIKTLQRFGKQQAISDALARKVQGEIERVLWEQRLPVTGPDASPINQLTRQMLNRLLEAYLPIQQGLDLEGLNPQTALLVVTERVLVPALAEAVASVTIDVEDVVWHRPWMIGDEFRGDQFWYLPVVEDGVLRYPLPRILEFWLRGGGLNKGYGLAKHLEGDNSIGSLKRRFERYANGENPESLLELHRYVDQVDRVDWLGGPADWKARFTLAWAIQTASEQLATLFSAHLDNPPLHFAELYRKTARFGLKYVDYGSVSFAARLFEDSLRKAGAFHEWPFCCKMRQHLAGGWQGGASVEDIIERSAVRSCLLSEARNHSPSRGNKGEMRCSDSSGQSGYPGRLGLAHNHHATPYHNLPFFSSSACLASARCSLPT